MIPITIRKEQKAPEAKPAVQDRTPKPRIKKQVANPVSIAVAVVVWLLTWWVEVRFGGVIGRGVAAWVGAFAGLFLLFAIKVADQWERTVVLRLGRFRSLRGPGPFLIIPVVDSIAQFVDQRVRVTDVTAESALTRDTVPVNVDAIVFWVIWDAKKAVLEVQDYFDAVALSAQTALRESIGRHELAEMITEREALGRELQRILDEKTNPWGITVHSVEIRDVNIPADLEDAMSRQAQAERERQARVILGTAETQIAGLFAQASESYHGNQLALHLRAMNMLYEAIKEKGAMVIVPSTAVETMGLGGVLGTAAVAGVPKPA